MRLTIILFKARLVSINNAPIHIKGLSAGQRSEGRQLVPSPQLRQARCHDDEFDIAVLLGLAPRHRAEEDDALNINIMALSSC